MFWNVQKAIDALKLANDQILMQKDRECELLREQVKALQAEKQMLYKALGMFEEKKEDTIEALPDIPISPTRWSQRRRQLEHEHSKPSVITEEEAKAKQAQADRLEESVGMR